MEAIPEGFVSIQIHMPPEVLDDLRAAARRSGLSTEDWLTRLLVSIPEPILEAADRLARRRRMSRSELFAEALAELLDSDESDEITARLDEVYGNRPSVLDGDLAALESSAIDEDW